MAIEQACARAVPKPWGRTDLRPWHAAGGAAEPIGELWFQPVEADTPEPALLLKLLFADEPLSIQVHPDDSLARKLGLGNGKTEAWCILEAKPGAKVALGLKRPLDEAQLRAAITDGSIAQLVQWRPVVAGDVVFVPAGTIHAIGAGLVIAEIQQRSDTTFRLFDHGRSRPLDIEHGIAAALARPQGEQPAARTLSDVRTMLLANPYFVLERIELPENSTWRLAARRETWLLALGGSLEIGGHRAAIGEAIFARQESASLAVGAQGLSAVLAYPGPDPDLDLLRRMDGSEFSTALRHSSHAAIPLQPTADVRP